jgi:hypothetical protein
MVLASVLAFCWLTGALESSPPNPQEVLYPGGLPTDALAVKLEEYVYPSEILAREIRATSWITQSRRTVSETNARCNLVVSTARVYESRLTGTPPKSLEELLTSPYALWKVNGLQPWTEHLGYQVVLSGKALMAAEGRFRRQASAGMVAVFRTSLAGGWAQEVGIFCALPDALGERSMNGGTFARFELDMPNPEERFRRHFWEQVSRQIEDAFSVYMAIHRQPPGVLEDLDSVVGPRNPKAWNPVIQRFSEELFQRYREYAVTHPVWPK